jgi:hypothetical protein
MATFSTISGMAVDTSHVEAIRHLISSHPDWHRSRLSMELCRLWNLRRADEGLRDMACRNLLLRLERRGLVSLPTAHHGSPNRHRRIVPVEHDTSLFSTTVSAVEPLCVSIATRGSVDERLFDCLMSAHHYLGMGRTVGENLKYLVRSGGGRPLACLLFGSAAWTLQPRDVFVGWDGACRARNLQRMTNNTRFLIPPWVRIPCLASRVLSLVARRVAADWDAKYGHPVHLLETFVDVSRFRGVCYRAANWIRLGRTTGRTRNSAGKAPESTVKDIYALPLTRHFRRELCR